MRRTRRSLCSAAVTCEPLDRRLLLFGGDPDVTFSNDGQTTLNFPGSTFQILDTAFQPDGKVIVAGTKAGNIALARLNVDGSLDTSFGSGGLFESSRRTQATEVLVQPDYKILIAFGAATQGFTNMAVGRVLAHGAGLDTAFGDTGIAHTSQWGADVVNDIALQADGKIIAVGRRVADDHDFAIVRYTTSGQPDNTFDNDAVVTASFGDNEEAKAVDIDYNGSPSTNPYWGKIVVVGDKWSGSNPPTRVVVCRLNTNGSFDNNFDGDGKLTSPDLSVNTQEFARGVICQPGGKIVLSGSAGSSVSVLNDVLLARYLPGGALDASFGSSGDGVVQSDFGGNEFSIDIAPSFLGGFLVSGQRNTLGLVAAYTANGLLDSRFSGNGWFSGLIPGAATLDTSLHNVAPIRRVAIAGGNTVARLWDVGSTVSLVTYDAEAAELGQNHASIYVDRAINPGVDERIYLNFSGTATPPTGLGAHDYDVQGMVFTLFNEGPFIDLPAIFSGVGADIVPVNDTLPESDETVIVAISPNDAYDIAPDVNNATLVIRDNDNFSPPSVTSSSFIYEDWPQRVNFTFNQNVGSSISDADFEVIGPAGTPGHTFSYNSVTNTVTLSFNSILPKGNYTARAIASGISNAQGTQMTTDHVRSWFFLPGDTDGNGVIDFDDYSHIDQGFINGRTGYSNGDFDYNGIVDFDDYSIIDFSFNTQDRPRP